MEEKTLQEEMDRLSEDLRLAHATGDFDGDTATELLQRMHDLQEQLREIVLRIMRERDNIPSPEDPSGEEPLN